MTAASQPQVVTLRSGDVVQVRQVQPDDAPALVRAYEYFTAEVLAENRAALALLPELGRVESESLGPVVTARVEIAEPNVVVPAQVKAARCRVCRGTRAAAAHARATSRETIGVTASPGARGVEANCALMPATQRRQRSVSW
jgi:hypothetical protein